LFALADEGLLGAAIGRWFRSRCPRPRSASDEMCARYHPEVIARRHLELYRELGVD
jgi:hypothetical protein